MVDPPPIGCFSSVAFPRQACEKGTAFQFQPLSVATVCWKYTCLSSTSKSMHNASRITSRMTAMVALAPDVCQSAGNIRVEPSPFSISIPDCDVRRQNWEHPLLEDEAVLGSQRFKSCCNACQLGVEAYATAKDVAVSRNILRRLWSGKEPQSKEHCMP